MAAYGSARGTDIATLHKAPPPLPRHLQSDDTEESCIKVTFATASHFIPASVSQKACERQALIYPKMRDLLFA